MNILSLYFGGSIHLVCRRDPIFVFFFSAIDCPLPPLPPPNGGRAIVRNSGLYYGHVCPGAKGYETLQVQGCSANPIMVIWAIYPTKKLFSDLKKICRQSPIFFISCLEYDTLFVLLTWNYCLLALLRYVGGNKGSNFKEKGQTGHSICNWYNEMHLFVWWNCNWCHVMSYQS